MDGAVLPIENSLHGSVAEHYDLLLEHDLRLDRESVLHIRHNLMASPGVKLGEIKRVLSHPVALSQCRASLQALRAELPGLEVQPFYDTAGSVKHVMEAGLRDTAGLAPLLAAETYGAHVLREGLEDHKENWTRFHLVRRAGDPSAADSKPDKLSAAFAVEHRPGTLVRALQRLADAGVDLTKIESRPVPGKPVGVRSSTSTSGSLNGRWRRRPSRRFAESAGWSKSWAGTRPRRGVRLRLQGYRLLRAVWTSAQRPSVRARARPRRRPSARGRRTCRWRWRRP